MNSEHDPGSVQDAYRRLEQIKERHEQQKVEEKINSDSIGPEGLTTQSFQSLMKEERHRLIAEITEEMQSILPRPEPMEVERFRSLVLTLDTVRHSADLRETYGSPLQVMRRVAIEYRDTALNAIVNRLVLEKPTDEDDADVIYIHDPVSKIRHTTALGGYREGYDRAMIQDEKERLAEQILYRPLPDGVPRI